MTLTFSINIFQFNLCIIFYDIERYYFEKFTLKYVPLQILNLLCINIITCRFIYEKFVHPNRCSVKICAPGCLHHKIEVVTLSILWWKWARLHVSTKSVSFPLNEILTDTRFHKINFYEYNTSTVYLLL